MPWLRGLAVEARDNVLDGGDNEVALGTADPVALPGTDILTVRGCLSGLLFQMDADESGRFQPDEPRRPAQPPQWPLAGSLGARRAGLLRPDAPAELDQPRPVRGRRGGERRGNVVGGIVQDVTLTITFTSTLSPPNPLVVAPPAGFVPGFACALEEYRYYVRQNFETPGDNTTPLKPRLARARMIPGTELPHDGDVANLSLDLADDIFDLQVALGFDTDYDSAGSGVGSFDDDADALGVDDVFYEGADDDARATDDWLGNSSADDPTGRSSIG